MRLIYSVLRFVPDAARAEFVNIGLIVGNERTEECSVTIDHTRRLAYSIADRRLVDAVWSYVLDLKLGLERRRAPWTDFVFSDSWLHERWAEGANLLQLSPPVPIAADDISDATAMLAGQFLHASVPRQRAYSPRKTAVISRVRRAYRESGLEDGQHLFERTLVRGKHHHEIFDFAVANGRAVQLAHTWNFAQQNVEQVSESIKAWAWTVQEIRATGGKGETDSKTFQVPKNVAVATAYIAPTTASGRLVFEEALHAFKEVDAVAVPESDLGKLAERAVRLLSAGRT